MMASQKNNYVVNYFTLDISDIIRQSQSSHQSSIACEYEILTENSNHIEINSNDVIEAELIDKMSEEENNNDNNASHVNKINILEHIVIPNELQELSENDDETSAVTSDDDEDLADLTNLNWLTELKNITNLPPATNEVTEKPCDPPSQRFDKFINQVHKIKENYEKRSELYRNVSSEKPPYNYAQIIAMAMLDEGRMTLKQICDWIENRFAYYKVHRNWNNSIRHNLSLNFFFSKVARDKNEKGKGGYWELAVDCNKTARKRIRQRKKKFGFNSNRLTSNKCAKAKVGKKHENSKLLCSDISATSFNSSNIGSDAFLSSPSNINDDSSLSTEDHTMASEIEVIEEQQNINNIIDDNQHAIIISNSLFGSPNVIVEAIPSYQFSQFNQIESFDDNEFSQLICMDDQELIDDFLSYNNETEEFL